MKKEILRFVGGPADGTERTTAVPMTTEYLMVDGRCHIYRLETLNKFGHHYQYVGIGSPPSHLRTLGTEAPQQEALGDGREQEGPPGLPRGD